MRKILITYFSAFPAKDKFTEQIAKIIAAKTGGTLAEIECEKKYPTEPNEYPLIQKLAPAAVVKQGLAIRGFDVEKGQEDTVEHWLHQLELL